MYLIAQLAGWLLLTMALAALAGWGFAAQRAAPAEAALRRDRMRLADDLAALAGESAAATNDEAGEREADTIRRLNDINIGRIAELERLLAGARASADEHASRVAELERELERGSAEAQAPQPATVVAVEPVAEVKSEPDAVALQGWRLRYFEQRVRYLESLTAAPPPPPAQAEPPAIAPLADWRARVAEARAGYLEHALRAAAAPAQQSAAVAPAEEAGSPFAANIDVDMLLRWRMLYLERRAAHLQHELDETRQSLAEPEPEPQAEPALDAAPDPDRWKWRARYLEARVRHMEQRLAERSVQAAALSSEEPERQSAQEPPRVAAERPPALAAARHGAPDDLRLIEGVSAMRQSSLNALGIWHFDQIAAWTAEHVAWVDRYLRLRGAIIEDDWIDQAADLARLGPAAARRIMEDEDA
ncbi:MAG: hypothetical protein KF700_05315 [Hyphomonadaceae bacterium]|nr:hypothetical protein [Hyphomonadaceae bacterium]